MSESGSLTIEVNTGAPLFNLTDIFGRQINLRNYQGKKVLIAFFRHAGCPFCNVRVHRLQKNMDEFKRKNLEMIFFFESKKEVLLGNDFHSGISPIPLIADPEKTSYQAYGIESSGLKSAVSHFTTFFQTVIKAKIEKLPVHWMAGKESIKTIPAEFLIDENGVVRKVHYAKNLTDQMSMDVILGFAESGRV
ncbi:MAG: redoxin domain-containing protein [Cyclobacteriaceae bacterium]